MPDRDGRRPHLCPSCGYVMQPLAPPPYLRAISMCGGACGTAFVQPHPTAERIDLQLSVGPVASA